MCPISIPGLESAPKIAEGVNENELLFQFKCSHKEEVKMEIPDMLISLLMYIVLPVKLCLRYNSTYLVRLENIFSFHSRD